MKEIARKNIKMHRATTVRDMVGEALRRPSDAQLELFLFVLRKEHNIKAEEVVYDHNKQRIEKAIREVVGISAPHNKEERDKQGASKALPHSVEHKESPFGRGDTEAS